MSRTTGLILIALLAVSLNFCTTTVKKADSNVQDDTQDETQDNTQDDVKEDTGDDVVPPQKREYNFKFVGYDINIDDPEKDRRSYYVIKIDKVEAGRTTIGLESQEKTFEYNITANRHLLMVEKWALDAKKGKYVKLNNIEQPKPAYTYFTLPENTASLIKLENDPVNAQAVYNIEIEE